MSRTAYAAPSAFLYPADHLVQLPWVPLRPFNVPVPMTVLAPTDDTILTEPPTGTGYVYGRIDRRWVPVVPIGGARMEGRLYLVGEPELAREGSTKKYVDDREFEMDGGFF